MCNLLKLSGNRCNDPGLKSIWLITKLNFQYLPALQKTLCLIPLHIYLYTLYLTGINTLLYINSKLGITTYIGMEAYVQRMRFANRCFDWSSEARLSVQASFHVLSKTHKSFISIEFQNKVAAPVMTSTLTPSPETRGVFFKRVIQPTEKLRALLTLAPMYSFFCLGSKFLPLKNALNGRMLCLKVSS
jgi:hypothetical protein